MLATYSRRGFSLLELVAVIVVVTILAGVTAVAYGTLIDQADVGADTVTLRSAVETAAATNAWTAAGSDPLFPLGTSDEGEWTDGLARQLQTVGYNVVSVGADATGDDDVSLTDTQGSPGGQWRAIALYADGVCIFVVVDFDANTATASTTLGNSEVCNASRVDTPGLGALSVAWS